MVNTKLKTDCHCIFYFLHPILIDTENGEENYSEEDFFNCFKNKNTKQFQELCISFKSIFSRDLFMLLEQMENKTLFNKIIFYIGLNSMPLYKRLFCKLYLLITNKKPYLNYEKTI